MPRWIIATVLVVAVGASIAAWRLWPRAPQGSMAAPAPAGPAAVGAYPAAELILQVNGDESVKVAPGTPVLFTVSLTAPAAERPIRIAASGRPWAATLRFESPDGKPFGARIDPLGPAAVYDFSAQRPAGALPGGDQSAGLFVDASRVHQVEAAINPDEAARLTPGEHDVHAVVQLSTDQDRTLSLTSNSVRLSVSAAAPANSAEETRRLESIARFHLRSEKWEDAHRIALQLVGRDGAGPDAYILLADSLNGLQQYQEALAAYHQALVLVPQPLHESPDYVLTRIEAVRQRLESASSRKLEPRF